MQEEKLGTKASLIGRNASGHFHTVDSEGNLDTIRLFKLVVDHSIGQPIGPSEVYLLYQLNRGDDKVFRRLHTVSKEDSITDYNYSDLTVYG